MIEITKTPGYQVGETFYPTVEAAQQGALTTIIDDVPKDGEGWTGALLASHLIENKDSVIAILRLKPRKKRAARRVAAATAKPAPKKRKATVEGETPTGN